MLYFLRVLHSAHPGLPVIVVGNLTVGGSGKTPLVLWIAEFLKGQGWSPAIVSRGYGAKPGAPRAASVADAPDQVGDEPTDLNLHPHSPGYRLILNNVLFPAAKKKTLKT